MATTTFAPVAGGGSGNGSWICLQMFESSFDLLTAFRDNDGNLELLAISTASNALKQVSGARAGAVKEVTLALFGRRAVTAVCDGSGDLLLISWDVPPGLKTVTRLPKDSGRAAGAATNIALLALSATLLATAMRDGSGNLLLITWSLNADGSFTRLGSSNPGGGKPNQAGAVSIVKMTVLVSSSASGSHGVVTAVRNGSGNLELIGWTISADGKTVTRAGPGATAGSVSEIEIAAAFGGGIATAVRDGSGNLLVIPWQPGSGGTFTRGHEVEAGDAQHLSIAVVGGSPVLVATMRNGSGVFEMIACNPITEGGLARSGSLNDPQNPNVNETKIVSMNGLALTAIRHTSALLLRSWTVTTPGRAQPLTTANVNEWFLEALADPARRTALRQDWVKLLLSEMEATSAEQRNLASLPAEEARALQAAITQAADHGGTIRLERSGETGPGTLTVRPAGDRPTPAQGKQADFSLGIFHCTFDANFQHWHCGWGPG